ncbi:hypothetical protein MB02_11570 [Croceicoccus estronivorus]|nr:hypothetical protein MB02_11570 [Croceicoccus estronivorus]
MIILWQPIASPCGRSDTDHSSDKPQFSTSLQLVYSFIDIIDIKHADSFEAIRMSSAEIGYPIIVSPHRESSHFAVWDSIKYEALTGIYYRRPYAVLLVFFYVEIWITRAGRNLVKCSGGSQLMRVDFKALPNINSEKRHSLFPVNVPPIAIFFRYHVRSAVAKFAFQ